MNPDRKSSISLENLLQLKRAEQPRPEFWTDFDKELRAKQLVAIMEKPHRWGGLPRFLVGMVRHPAPLGAAAALILTTLGFREFHSSAAPRAEAVVDVPQMAPVAAPVSLAPAPVAPNAVVSTPVASRPAGGDEVAAAAPAPVRAEVSPSESESEVRIDGEVPMAVSFSPSSSGRAITANFAMAAAPDPQLARNLFGAMQIVSTGNHLQVTRSAVVDPLARMAPPSSDRRSRILMTDALPAMSTFGEDPAPPASDRLVSRLSDDRLYESISRYGAGGDHFSVKF